MNTAARKAHTSLIAAWYHRVIMQQLPAGMENSPTTTSTGRENFVTFENITYSYVFIGT
jgi:hypothetical protein